MQSSLGESKEFDARQFLDLLSDSYDSNRLVAKPGPVC